MATNFKNRVATVLKKAANTSVKYLRNFTMRTFKILLFVVSLLVTALDALASFIWLPLVYIVSAKTAAQIIYKNDRTNKLAFIHSMAMRLCGIFWWDWFIQTSLCPTRKRIAFIDVLQKNKDEDLKLAHFSSKQQIEYWLAKRDYNLLQDMSYDAAIELFNNAESLEQKRNFIKVLGLTPEILKSIFNSSYSEELSIVYEMANSYETKKDLLGLYNILSNALKGFRQLEKQSNTRWTNLGNFINAFGYNKFSPSCITHKEEAELWNSRNEQCRKLVLQKRVLKGCYLNSLIQDKQFELLSYAIQTTTPSSKQIEWLIELASTNIQLENLLFNFIVTNGLDIKILKKVYDTHKKIAPKLQEAVDIHGEIVLIKGFFDCSEEDNLEFWKKYIDQNKKVTPTAQVQMKLEHFRIFSEAGLKLERTALEYLIVNINEQAYFELLLEKEFKNITPQMVSLIKAKPWKYNLYMNEKARKNTQE